MASELRLSFPATVSGLVASLEAMDHAGVTLNLSPSLVSRVRIIVEELFSNTIKYGYGGECEKPVRLSLRPHPELTLTYEDEAPPFNPLVWKAKRAETFAPEARPAGQAGIAMVMGLSAKTSYQRCNGANCLTITFAERR